MVTTVASMNAIAEARMVATNKKGRFCSGQPVSDLKPRAARPCGQKGRWKALPAPVWACTGLVMATAWILPGWNSSASKFDYSIS